MSFEGRIPGYIYRRNCHTDSSQHLSVSDPLPLLATPDPVQLLPSIIECAKAYRHQIHKCASRLDPSEDDQTVYSPIDTQTHEF